MSRLPRPPATGIDRNARSVFGFGIRGLHTPPVQRCEVSRCPARAVSQLEYAWVRQRDQRPHYVTVLGCLSHARQFATDWDLTVPDEVLTAATAAATERATEPVTPAGTETGTEAGSEGRTDGGRQATTSPTPSADVVTGAYRAAVPRRAFGTANDAGVVSPVRSAHSCRACGFWSEGLYPDDPERARREMDRGLCDACYPEAMAAWRAGADKPLEGIGIRRRAARDGDAAPRD